MLKFYEIGRFPKRGTLDVAELRIEQEGLNRLPEEYPVSQNGFIDLFNGGKRILGTDIVLDNRPGTPPKWYYFSQGALPGRDRIWKEGLVGLHAVLKNISRPDAIKALATIYNFDLGAPLAMKQQAMSFMSGRIPQSISLSGELWKLMGEHAVSAPHSNFYYFVGTYENEEGARIQLPFHASLKRDRDYNLPLVPGYYPKSIPLGGLNLLAKHPNARVILVSDIGVAEAINNHLLAIAPGGLDGLVAVAFWAGCSQIEAHEWGPLMGRSVTYLPVLRRDAIAAGIDVHAALSGKDVDFSILLRPIRDSEAEPCPTETECPEYAYRKSMPLTRREVVMLSESLSEAWDFKRYKRFCEEESLIESDAESHSPEGWSLFRSSRLDRADAGAASRKDGLALDELIKPSYFTIVIGESDVGKTLFTRTLALAMAAPANAFIFTAQKQRPVYYLSAEQDVDATSVSMNRCMAALGVATMPAGFKDASLRDNVVPDRFPAFDLLNSVWQEQVERELLPNSVLVIDNLFSATTDSTANAKLAQKLQKFASILREKQVSMIVVHHTGKNGGLNGSQALEDLSQNVLFLHHADSTNGTGHGVNAVLTIKKCKPYPQLKGARFSLHLGHNPDMPEAGGAWQIDRIDKEPHVRQPAPEACGNEISGAGGSSSEPDTAGLHPIDKDILAMVHKRRNIQRADIASLGHNTNTVKQRLRVLTDNGKLVRNGTGKGTYYTLPAMSQTEGGQ